MNQPNSPQQDDAILGGRTPQTPLSKSAVLGGILAVQRRFAAGDVEQRRSALSDALQYGNEGLELLFRALRDPSAEVSSTAYELLQQPNLQQQFREQENQKGFPAHEFYRSFRCLCTLTQSACRAMTITADGVLVLATRSGFEVWELAARKQKFQVAVAGGVSRIAVTPDGKTLLTSNGKSIQLWNLSTGQATGNLLSGDKISIRSMAISPDGETLVTTSDVWNLNTQTLLYTISSDRDHLQTVAICPNGKYWVGGDRLSDIIRVSELTTGQVIYRMDVGIAFRVRAIAVSADGSKLVGSDWYGVRVWNFYTQKELFTVPEFRDTSLGGHLNQVSCFALSPTSHTLFIGGLGYGIQVWGLSSGSPLITLRYGSDRVSTLAISPDGQRLVSSDRTGKVMLWGI